MTTEFEKSAAAFRQYLPSLDTPRFETAKVQDVYSYVEIFQKTQNPPWLYHLTKTWEKLLAEPFKGITTDGNVTPGLFKLQDQGVPVGEIAGAVQEVLDQLTEEEKSALIYPINAREWRAWSNPEFLLRPLGLRLEEVDEKVALLILDVLKTTLSPEGYVKALGAMHINEFLGHICEVPRIMNRYSYNFLVFGTPSEEKPWGWSLYGHHFCINTFLCKNQIVISPTFTGAEPNLIDAGEFAGTTILQIEGEIGLALMQSLPVNIKKQAQIYKLLHDPAMLQTGDLAVDRWNQDDQRHLCGAFRDNRVVPIEGVRVSDLSSIQQQQVLDIIEQFVLYLPQRARRLRIEQVAQHLSETYFSWIGSWGDDDPFYYRIQSPVIIIEFDHHSGVFLSNKEPAKFHTHTILRSPNDGDYGNALRGSGERIS